VARDSASSHPLYGNSRSRQVQLANPALWIGFKLTLGSITHGRFWCRRLHWHNPRSSHLLHGSLLSLGRGRRVSHQAVLSLQIRKTTATMSTSNLGDQELRARYSMVEKPSDCPSRADSVDTVRLCLG
jgi:hypothetical protein